MCKSHKNITIKTVIAFCIGIYLAKSQETIRCGETKTGYRGKGQEIEYEFVSPNTLNQVYLEGCDSNYDMVLSIKNWRNRIIQFADDDASCANQRATDITFPDNYFPIQSGEQYTFVVSGYSRQDIGDYSVTLVCAASGSATSAPVTTSPPVTVPVNPGNPSCDRHREAWHLISDSQRSLFIDGYKALASNGKLRVFTNSHRYSAEHGNAAFLPWHRYYIYELETQIRNLGGRFSCFSLPYWDWTHEVEEHGLRVDQYDILDSGLGGDGQWTRDGSAGCVTGEFGPNLYTASSGGCLTRRACTSRCSMSDASELMTYITNDQFYGGDSERDGEYRNDLESSPHAFAHTQIGGHLYDILISPDDPIFYLLHSFVDYQYSLWQDCNEYEDISNSDITRTMFGGDLDEELTYGALDRASWSDISQFRLTIRMLHDNEAWGVSYDKGDFFDRAHVESNRVCQGNINPNWFQQRRRRLVNDGGRKNKKKSECREYSDDVFTKLHSRVGGESCTKTQNQQLYKTWAEMNCQYLTMENKCERPKYFDDCSDMERSYGNNGNDIDITLDELIEKVSDYPCMVETRNKFYKWAQRSSNLYGLCNGQYDSFCDKNFKKEKGADKCLAKLNKKNNKEYMKSDQDEEYMKS